MTVKKPLILIDGSSYLYRAFFALLSLSNSKGQLTVVIYGILNMLRKIVNDYEPEHFVWYLMLKEKLFVMNNIN